MSKILAIRRPLVSLLLLLAVFIFNVLPLLLLNEPAYAAGTISSRKITIGTSKISTSTTYNVSFILAHTTSIKGIVVDFCNDAGGGPVIGTVCSTANHTVSGITTSGTIAVTQTSGFGAVNFTAQTPGGSMSAGSALVMTAAGGTGGTTDTTHAVTFSFTATNPSALAPFYARILTYSTTTDATSYDSTLSVANPGSNVIDSGSVALSTANQLTISARVQEVLQFCVGTTSVDNSTTTIANDCSGSFLNNCATAVDLGILTTSSVSISPVPVSTATLPGGGNNCNGAAMVRTNASQGVVVTYYAEQETSSGKLKVVGASCSGSSNTDQCFNDPGGTTHQAAFTAGTEDFGVTVAGINCNGTSTTSYSCDMGSGTNKLHASTDYIGTNATTFGHTNGFDWRDDGSTDQLASSTGPVDDETMVLEFAATPTITTPTGAYTVTSTYVATATF